MAEFRWIQMFLFLILELQITGKDTQNIPETFYVIRTANSCLFSPDEFSGLLETENETLLQTSVESKVFFTLTINMKTIFIFHLIFHVSIISFSQQWLDSFPTSLSEMKMMSLCLVKV